MSPGTDKSRLIRVSLGSIVCKTAPIQLRTPSDSSEIGSAQFDLEQDFPGTESCQRDNTSSCGMYFRCCSGTNHLIKFYHWIRTNNTFIDEKLDSQLLERIR
jgi:hypothetical protein